MTQREIKFRCWEKKSAIMRAWDYLRGIDYTRQFALFDDPDFVWMQYTGLTNNGQEWYDGDILENDTDWYQIAWDEDQACWEAIGIRTTGESLMLSELLSSETWGQGNIYENPDLLTPPDTKHE